MEKANQPESKNPEEFQPEKEDLKRVAGILSKYFSPNKVLTDPKTGEALARGSRKDTEEKDINQEIKKTNE